MAAPFNTVKELLAFTSFEHGAPNGTDSVRRGTFAFSQFQTALRNSRNEILRKTGGIANNAFSEDRREELKESELWLSAARLMPRFGERIAVKTVDANMAGIASVQLGADTPPPSGPGSKGEYYVKFMYQRFRAIGLELLNAKYDRWGFTHSNYWDRQTDRFPTLLPGVFSL